VDRITSKAHLILSLDDSSFRSPHRHRGWGAHGQVIPLWFNFQRNRPWALGQHVLSKFSHFHQTPEVHRTGTSKPQADSSCPCSPVQVSMCCAEIFGCLLVLQRSCAMTQASLGRKPCTPVPARCSVGSGMQNLACTECVCLCKAASAYTLSLVGQPALKPTVQCKWDWDGSHLNA
jgi:hypothetical protein